MSIKYRICACALLALTALFCASYTIADLRILQDDTPPIPSAAVKHAETGSVRFALYAQNGCVAVLDPALGERAVVTDIELVTLRETDRQLIEAGLQVDSREELLSLLEDLGS